MHARKRAYTCGGGIETCKKCNPLRVWLLRLAESYPGRGVSRRRSREVSGRARDGLETGSRWDDWHGRARFRKVQISWQAQHFGKVGYRFRGRCISFARSSADFVTGAAFSYFWHGHVANPIGTDAQGGACRFRGRGSVSARSGIDFVAGASLFARSST